MYEPAAKKVERPMSITAICALGFMGIIRAAGLVFSPIAQEVAPWYPAYLGVWLVVGFVCMLGLWMMKKWAAYIYTGIIALHEIISFTMGSADIIELLMLAIIVFFMLKNVSKMT